MTTLAWARSQLNAHRVPPCQRRQAIRVIRQTSGLAIPLPRACEYVDRLNADNLLVQEILRSAEPIADRIDQAIDAILAHPDVVLAAVDEARRDVARMAKPASTLDPIEAALIKAGHEFDLIGDNTDDDPLRHTVWVPLNLKPANPDTSGFWHRGEMAAVEAPELKRAPIEVDQEYWSEERNEHKGFLRRAYGWVLAVFTEATTRPDREVA